MAGWGVQSRATARRSPRRTVHWSFWVGLPFTAAGWALLFAGIWYIGVAALGIGAFLLYLGMVVYRPYRPSTVGEEPS